MESDSSVEYNFAINSERNRSSVEATITKAMLDNILVETKKLTDLIKQHLSRLNKQSNFNQLVSINGGYFMSIEKLKCIENKLKSSTKAVGTSIKVLEVADAKRDVEILSNLVKTTGIDVLTNNDVGNVDDVKKKPR